MSQNSKTGSEEIIPSYFALAVICTFLCFPTAIISIRESLNCERFKAEKRWEDAKKSSEKARQWLFYSFITGIFALLFLSWVIYLLWPLLTEGIPIIRSMFEGEGYDVYY